MATKFSSFNAHGFLYPELIQRQHMIRKFREEMLSRYLLGQQEQVITCLRLYLVDISFTNYFKIKSLLSLW